MVKSSTCKNFHISCTHVLETWIANTKTYKKQGENHITSFKMFDRHKILQKDTNISYDIESALWISWARTTSSKSSSRSMSVRHEQGVSPFPLSQCWNMARQQATGLLGYSALIRASFEPVLSKSSWSPSLCQNGATLSMILIFFPWAVRSRDSLPRLGVAPKSKTKLRYAWGWTLN